MAETVMAASPEHIRYLRERGFAYHISPADDVTYAAFWEPYLAREMRRGLIMRTPAGWRPRCIGRSMTPDWDPKVWFNDPVAAFVWAEVQQWQD